MMENINIRNLCFMIIATTFCCLGSNKTVTTPFKGIKISQKKSVPTTFEKIKLAVDILNLFGTIKSFFPSEEDKRANAQHELDLAEQVEVNQAKKAFYQCCREHRLSPDCMDSGLPVACVSVAYNYAQVSDPQTVDAAIAFVSKFRE